MLSLFEAGRARFSALIGKIVHPLARCRSELRTPEAYRVFTKEFDEIIRSSDLINTFGELTEEENIRLARDVFELHCISELVFRVAISVGDVLVGAFRRRYSREERERSVVSILIDHSGSMRGQNMIAVIPAVLVAVNILRRCHVKFEVLGFTTVGWRGGRSQDKWLQAGRPPNPGRLCDLRHIVYCEVGGRPPTLDDFSYALRPDALFENVDGEAIEWAAGRLEAGNWAKRHIIVVSDGAPVDDSTLFYNSDPDILRNHLKEVVERLNREGAVRLASLLLSEFSSPIDLTESARSPAGASIGMLALLHRLLLDGLPAHFERDRGEWVSILEKGSAKIIKS